MPPRPFRFIASLNDNSRLGEVAAVARKAEAVGCSVFVLPDHLVGFAALLPLATVAAATERIRVGTYVRIRRFCLAAARGVC
jgi:alkanesulfonate monooxygenase SsuD/methylene tetrahydromethanopterin reductase-like flavin-dependent oxidoreductase (luciferase family)